jgi:hypothetical protein
MHSLLLCSISLVCAVVKRFEQETLLRMIGSDRCGAAVLVTGGGAGGTADADACACARLNNAGPLAHITRSSCFAKGAHNNTTFDLGLFFCNTPMPRPTVVCCVCALVPTTRHLQAKCMSMAWTKTQSR